MTDRKWFKIGETAQQIGVSPKELRYWEEVIPEIKARRSKGNLRYYHLDELPRLKRIKAWLSEGLTVADCRELMIHGHLAQRLDLGLDPDEAPAPPPRKPQPSIPRLLRASSDLQPAIRALRGLLDRLSTPPRP